MRIHLEAADQHRPIVLTGGRQPSFQLGAVGPGSYINDMDLQVTPGDQKTSLQIGNYCSLAYGIMFATVITLILIPSLVMIQEDISALLRRVRAPQTTAGERT